MNSPNLIGNMNSPSQPRRQQQQHVKKRSGSWGDLPLNDSQLTQGNGRAFSQRLEKRSGPGDNGAGKFTKSAIGGLLL